MLNHHSFSPLSYLSFHHLRYLFDIYNYSRYLWWSDLSKVLYFSSLSDPSQCDSNTKDFWMNMQTLTAYLKKLAEQNPSSSYYNVDIMKYQVQQTGITAWGLSSFYSDEVYLTEVVCWSFSCHLLDARLTTGSIHCQQGHTLYQEMESPALWRLVQLTDPDPVRFFLAEMQKCMTRCTISECDPRLSQVSGSVTIWRLEGMGQETLLILEIWSKISGNTYQLWKEK